MRIVLDLQSAQGDSRFRGIGRYSLALAQAVARQAKNHEVWLAMSGRFPDAIGQIRTQFANLIPTERMRVFDLPGPVAEMALANSWRTQAAELLREKFLGDLSPDIVHVSTLFEGIHNEVVASVGRLDTGLLTAVTLYDLIPILRPEIYLTDPVWKRNYLRRAQSLKRANLVLAISDSSRQEAIDALQICPERIRTIGAGLSPSFFQFREMPRNTRASLLANYGLREPFVMYTGGDDPRKNLEGLIVAFTLLPKDIRGGVQLAIVCKLSEGTRKRLMTVAWEHGLKENEFVFPGYVPDEDLLLLYASCSVFVFPSLHEGFGLPVLEAMACGAPVIGSNCTSIPEIINRKDALFDPRQPQDIANRLAEVLSNADLRQSLKRWGLERAKVFTWEASARKALQAFEELHAKRKNVQTITLPATQRRPLLGFVSPLPPERTGIAGYCANLLPNLARHYEIICIIDQPEVTDPWITAEFAIRDVHWFEANSAKFERIVYHFGNSSLHKHMFALIERHPGVVVLHDFYLGDLLNWMASDYMPGCFTKALYDSHGFSALERNRSSGCEATTTVYPCNAAVLRDSVGVIVHSEYAIELARKWYGDRGSAFMRRVPFLPFPPGATDRLAARKRLGLPENAFVVSSFGLLTAAKLSHRLLEAWLDSPLSQDEGCFLVFVGENDNGDYGRRLSEKVTGSSAAPRIRIPGYVEEPHYRDYLAASDLAVQLRARSRGETSAAIFDCLSRNVPLVINAHGSAAELPDDVVMKLDDDFADAELSAALTRLRAEPSLRQKLAERGALYLKEQHHPERIAELYRNTIEELYNTSFIAREQTLLRAIARIATPALSSDSDLAAVATAIAANRERFGPNQMLIDVSRLAESDARSGIQRVTRAILMALISDPPPGYRIEPIRAVGDGYVYARRFACQSLVLPEDGLTDDPVETGRDDIFIGLDLSIDFVPSLKPWFLSQRRHGMQIVFVVYDLLALRRPEFFPSNLPPVVRDWFNTVAEVADGMVCISRAVVDELHAWLARFKPQRLPSIALGSFHLGADLRASLPSKGLSEDALAIIARFRSRPSFLMVGTLEPRKGYRQALAAMEQLWADGMDTNLVIIGKQGWNTDDLAKRIQQHPERNKRLFWLPGISDEMLEQVYRSAHALLAASEGEGFGLPLIEAAHYGLPIIARDIPVFREVAGEHAYYFRGEDPEDLAHALQTWLSLGDAVPASTNLPSLTWQQSSRQLLEVVLGGRWISRSPDANHILSLANAAGRSHVMSNRLSQAV